MPAESPTVILALGKEPVLPLSLLEGLSDAELRDLIGKLGKEKDRGPAQGEEGNEEAEESEEESPEAEEPVEGEAAAADAEATEAEAEEEDAESALTRASTGMGGESSGSSAGRTPPEGERQRTPKSLSGRSGPGARGLLRRVLAPGEMYPRPLGWDAEGGRDVLHAPSARRPPPRSERWSRWSTRRWTVSGSRARPRPSWRSRSATCPWAPPRS